MTGSITGYWLGRTPTIACQADQRFSYCLYVPPAYAQRAEPPKLLVVLHDTLRNHQALRDAFAVYAERANVIVLAPLFPAGIGTPDDLDHYKYLRYGDIHFDQLLLAMTAEVAAKYGVSDTRFALFGFSGGAHFAHRFLYLQPHRLASVVAGSPGSVTLPTEDYDWWPGLGGFAAIFGRPVDWDQVRAVPTCLVVGADDVNTRGIVSSADHPNWVEGANAAGTNRVERLRTLHRCLRERGVDATLKVLDNVGHSVDPIIEAAIAYFEGQRR